MKKYLAEGVGTFALTFMVALALAGRFPVATPVLAALVLGLFVYSIGHISGAHINPAVTIGLWSIKKISLKDAAGYIVAQALGAGAAMLVAAAFSVTPAASGVVALNTTAVGLAELIGTFFFTFGIASVVHGKTPSQLSGVVVGGSLLLGVTLASLLGSNGVLNPAVAFGIGSFSLMYVLAPIVGSVLGMNAYSFLME